MDETENLSPAVTRRRLRTELRRARLDAGLTQEQTARAMDWSLSKLIRIENGTNNISTNDLKALAEYYQISDEKQVEEWLALARTSRERSWWSTSDISRPLAQLIEYENAAYLSRHFQDLVMPGLLQTTDYMRESTRQLAPSMTASQVDAVIQVRLKRQELLKRPDAPLMHFVLDEAVIRRAVGGNDVRRGQLQKLIEAAGMSNITVEVVPFSAGLVPGLLTPFVIHEFPDPLDDDVLYQESPRGDLISRDDTEEVVAYREYFEQLRQASLGPEGTIKFLDEVIAELS
jgi:transcriptional regulator with XRE-family HTH domain